MELLGNSWLDYVELAGYLILPAFLMADLFWHDRLFQTAKFWRGRAAIVSLVNVYLTGYVAVYLGGVFAGTSLLNLSTLNVFAGAAVGVVVYELAHYWYHRLAHGWNPLWKLTHQMHHAAESVDAFGAFYIHPLDSAIFTAWASLVFFPLLGLSPEAGLVASVFLTFNAVFQHANIRTPHWLGYIIQRPESHRIHHARGVHRYNYSDLPLWDMLFGTFKNPQNEGAAKAGFYDFASTRIGEMLFFKDVSKPKEMKVERAEAA